MLFVHYKLFRMQLKVKFARGANFQLPNIMVQGNQLLMDNQFYIDTHGHWSYTIVTCTWASHELYVTIPWNAEYAIGNEIGEMHF